MANRRDLIDNSLRPGRFEVQVESATIDDELQF